MRLNVNAEFYSAFEQANYKDPSVIYYNLNLADERGTESLSCTQEVYDTAVRDLKLQKGQRVNLVVDYTNGKFFNFRVVSIAKA